ncbi:MAG: hypothetical protein ACON3Z_18080 [Bradymonadia bacterium]
MKASFARVMSSLILLGLALGCSGRKEGGPAKLDRLRILGILSDRNEIPIEDLVLGSAGVLTVGVADFHPSDLTDAPIERRYEWQLCFSLGSLAKFECVSPDNTLEPVGMEATTEFNLDSSAISRLIPPEFLALVGDLSAGMAPPNYDGTTATCPERLGDTCEASSACAAGATCADGICVGLPAISPVPLVVRVTVTDAEGEAVTAARSINIRFSGAANQNPRLGGMSIGEGQFQPKALTAIDQTCSTVGPFDAAISQVPLAMNFEPAEFERYASADEDECTIRDEADSMFVSWFTTNGAFENNITTPDYRDNKLFLDDDAPLRVRLYAAIRDGRGGLELTCLEFVRGEMPAAP